MPVSRRRKSMKARQMWKSRGKPTAGADLVTEQGTSSEKPFNPSSDMWKCGCGVKNANSMSWCLHCSTKRPEVSKADHQPNTSSASTTTSAKPKEEPAKNSKALRGSSLPRLSSLFQKPPGDWVCPTCSVSNKKHQKKCFVCGDPKPRAKPVPSNGAISPAPTTGPNVFGQPAAVTAPGIFTFGAGSNTQSKPAGVSTNGAKPSDAASKPDVTPSFSQLGSKRSMDDDGVGTKRGRSGSVEIEGHKCYVTGRGIQPKGVRVDDHCDFRVHTENAGGEAEVIAKVIGSGGVEEKLTLRRIDPKTYEYSYVPKIIGLYVVSITYGGQGVARSPFCVEVGPKESRIRALGPGLQHGIVGYPAWFTVNTNGKTCGFSIEGPSLAKIDYKDNGDGSANISYWPTVAGEYAVHILCNAEDIPQSPFMVDVTPSTTNFDPTTPQDLVQEESNPSHVEVCGPASSDQPVTVHQPTHLTVDCLEAGQDTCMVCCCVLVGLKRYEHPFFNGGLCPKCKKVFLGSIFLFDREGNNSYCIICGYGREIFLCEVVGCNKVYCTDCIRRLAGEDIIEAVRETDKWNCFLCTTYDPEKHGLLNGKPEWRTNLASFFQPTGIDIFPNKGLADRQSIRVLSLFDGIGAGKLVLDQLNIQIEKYFASEVEPDAITVAQTRYPGLIHHLGDVRDVQRETLNEIGPIDLLIGGNELSGLEAGSGLLFSDFCRILWSLKTQNRNRPLFWIYEKVARKNDESLSHISRMLEREPALWDAKYFSSQGPACNVWGNIPGMYCPLQYSASQAGGSLDDNLSPARKAKVQKVRTIRRRRKSVLMDRNKKNSVPVTMGDADDRNFGFPELYTNVANLSTSRRLELLGQSWSVPVMRHLLSPLRNYFQATSNAAETLSGASVANNPGAKVTTAVSAANASTSSSTSCSN